ncbi:hypothetical protein MPNT_230025 [Candidatus Methylacidithermus pantelleriae]|uniref:Uncharacterized protein n=1 Tax=Candidatus Methylacidithermus pantelleriae TaxID=2744239 RepID=A0A8J2BPY9_9BACT|nr:hypothetical protein MPNT_230025 [Candidatus Methylacidithermus pantelleriae]
MWSGLSSHGDLHPAFTRTWVRHTDKVWIKAWDACCLVGRRKGPFWAETVSLYLEAQA